MLFPKIKTQRCNVNDRPSNETDIECGHGCPPLAPVVYLRGSRFPAYLRDILPAKSKLAGDPRVQNEPQELDGSQFSPIRDHETRAEFSNSLRLCERSLPIEDDSLMEIT